MEANFGLGSPQLFFYFPIPFYITSLFYPLRYLGFGVEQIYLLGVYAACITTFATTTLWLQTVTTSKRAALCAFIFLWLPYRMEVMAYRHSYAELWGIALLPLLFLSVRMLINSQRSMWSQISLITALCLLCHAPITLIGMMGAGAQILVHCWRDIRKMLTFAVAVTLGFAMTLFHLLPAKILTSALNETKGGTSSWKMSWVNSYATEIIQNSNHFIAAVTLLIFTIFLSIIALWLWNKRKYVADSFIKKEMLVWLLVIICAYFLMFPVSAPLWQVIELFSHLGTMTISKKLNFLHHRILPASTNGAMTA
jgi:hypothetical protein